MTDIEAKQLKKDKSIFFLYKIPCSYYPEKFKYIIVTNTSWNSEWEQNNTRCMLVEDWFNYMKSGSLLCYICCYLNKAYKLKEYINIYTKPDIIKLRQFLTKFKSTIYDQQPDYKYIDDYIAECLWGIQFIHEAKVNRVDIFKNNIRSFTDVFQLFIETSEQIYQTWLNNK